MCHYNLLDLPDMQVDFNHPISVSCGLKNQDELMDYFIPYLNDWSEHQYNVHEFAQKYAMQLTLWTANDIPVTEEAKTHELICFRVQFGTLSGEVLFHCKIKARGWLQ